MKYIEELSIGCFFIHRSESFILTADFRQNKNSKKYMCINIDNGMSRWLNADDPVDLLDVYKRDKEGNILPLKEYIDEYKKFA